MSDPKALVWIEAGYHTFAQHGPAGLQVEKLARDVGISKSSFYHHFEDIPSFIHRLLEYHEERVVVMSDMTRACKTFVPEFLDVLIERRAELFFNRQLRSHREDLTFQLYYQRTTAMVVDAVLVIWADYLGIPGQHVLARDIFNVVVDLFYQRFKKDELTHEWLMAFLQELHAFMNAVVQRNGLQGGVPKG